MRLLYVVFVVSMIALVWAVLSVRRHIRHHDQQQTDAPGQEAPVPDDPLQRRE